MCQVSQPCPASCAQACALGTGFADASLLESLAEFHLVSPPKYHFRLCYGFQTQTVARNVEHRDLDQLRIAVFITSAGYRLGVQELT